MSDTLDIVITCDLRIKIPSEDLNNAFGTTATPEIIQQVVQSLTPKSGENQSGVVKQWMQDNEPDFEVMGIQGIWS